MVRLALIAMLVSGCLWKPNKLFGDDGGTGDVGSGSGSDAGVQITNMVPRVVGRAYWNDGSGLGSTGMTQAGYSIYVDGTILEGDLLLLVGNIDNKPVVNPPDAGFAQAVNQTQFGADGQTYFAFKRLATATEPPEMAAPYGGSTGGSTTILLIAITGASPTIISKGEQDGCNSSEMACGTYDTVEADSTGVPTQNGDIVIYAAGADWQDVDMPITFNPPAGYTLIDAFTDRNDGKVRWTSMMVAYTKRDSAPAAVIQGSFSSPGNKGQFWAAAFPIHPMP